MCWRGKALSSAVEVQRKAASRRRRKWTTVGVQVHSAWPARWTAAGAVHGSLCGDSLGRYSMSMSLSDVTVSCETIRRTSHSRSSAGNPDCQQQIWQCLFPGANNSEMWDEDTQMLPNCSHVAKSFSLQENHIKYVAQLIQAFKNAKRSKKGGYLCQWLRQKRAHQAFTFYCSVRDVH